MTATLPERTRNFLAHGAPEGQRNAEAHYAAQQLRDAGVVEVEALAMVERGAAACGLPQIEARNAVRSAYKKPAREPITKAHGGNGHKPSVAPLSRPASPPVSAAAAVATNTPAATFDYHDEAGNVLSQSLRYQWPDPSEPKGYGKTFRQRRPDGKGGWAWGVEGVRRVLYRLPEVLKAGEVFVAEGEAKADALTRLGFVGTCNVGGAGKWLPAYNDTLAGKRVVILPDNDPPGQDHAALVARNLYGKAASVKILALPNLPPKGDVIDFLRTFTDPTEAGERLAIMAEGAATWTPTPEAEPTPEARKPIVRPLSAFAVASDPITDPANLLGRRFLCRGGALLLAGPTGIGKSSLLLQAAITFGLGRPLFGIAPAGKLRALLVQAENDDGDVAEMRDGVFRGLTLTEAEQAEAGAAVQVVCESVATGLQFIGLAGELIAEHKPDLFLIDPLFAFCGCNVSDQEKMSAFLRNGLNPLLQEHGCGLILAHHTNKPASGKEKPDWKAGDFAYLGSGTAELANWARAVVGLRSIGAHNVFEVVLGKRGKRAGLVTNEGEPLYSFHIKHAAAGICWELATAADLEGQGKPKPGKPELLRLIPAVGCIGQAALLNKAAEIGIGKNRCRDLLAELKESATVYEWTHKRPGTNDAKSYSQQPQQKELD